jgi:hypothetical protein
MPHVLKPLVSYRIVPTLLTCSFGCGIANGWSSVRLPPRKWHAGLQIGSQQVRGRVHLRERKCVIKKIVLHIPYIHAYIVPYA